MDGSNDGIKRTFKINTDLFALGVDGCFELSIIYDSRLVVCVTLVTALRFLALEKDELHLGSSREGDGRSDAWFPFS